MKRLFCSLGLAFGVVGSLFASYGLEFDPVRDASKAAASYLAPTCRLMFRLCQPDGVLRELEYSAADHTRLSGADGWSGTIEGDTVRITTGPDALSGTGGSATLVYRKGRLRSFSRAGQTVEFNPSVRAEKDGLGALWPEAQAETRDVEHDLDVWRGKSRFRLGYANPNRTATLLAELFVLFAGLSLFFRRGGKFVRLGLLAAALASLVLIFATESRGGFVAAALGGLCLLAGLSFHRVGLRRALGCVLILAALVAVGVSVGGVSASRFVHARSRGNDLRVDILKKAPRMMADAPGGWGFVGPGKAYLDWYQGLNDRWLTFTLVSDHLTQLVRFGRPLRLAYLTFWFFVLAALFAAARRGHSPIPLGIFAALFAAAAFNRVLEAGSLWALPIVSSALLLRRPSAGDLRRHAVLLGGSAALAGIVLLAFSFFSATPTGELSIRAQDGRVTVKDAHPAIWLVDDGCVFGGGLAAKEIRARYFEDPSTPPVGYVRSVSDLSSHGIQRLVLGGLAGAEFLQYLTEGLFPADFDVPPEILFISPPFPPSVVPELLLKNVTVRLVIGEFASWYYRDYATPPAWVTVVPAAELYLPSWMDIAVSRGGAR